MTTSWGDVSREVNVASARKSLLSTLYGIAVSEEYDVFRPQPDIKPEIASLPHATRADNPTCFVLEAETWNPDYGGLRRHNLHHVQSSVTMCWQRELIDSGDMIA